MQHRKNSLRDLLFGPRPSRAAVTRRPRRVILSCDSLEERVTPAHGAAHHAVAHLHAAAHHASHATTASTISSSAVSTSASTSASTSTSSSTLSTAQQTLQSEVQTIQLASGTTIGELTALQQAFQTLRTDGLSPTSQSALQSFENGLVTSFANGDVLASDATLLGNFEALYTSTPTTQESTNLTTAYNALAAAVTSSNVTSADISAINTDWSAVLAAQGSTSTATYPYFNLVTGHGGPGGGPGGGGCM